MYKSTLIGKRNGYKFSHGKKYSHQQTKASDSILNSTALKKACPRNQTALIEAVLSGTATAREVLECALSSTQTKQIVTEYSNPCKQQHTHTTLTTSYCTQIALPPTVYYSTIVIV